MHDIFSFLSNHDFLYNDHDHYIGNQHNDLSSNFFHHQIDNSYDYNNTHHQELNLNGHDLTDYSLASTNHIEEVIGNPAAEISHVHMQEGIKSCAIASQKGVIESITGKQVPEMELSYDAYKHGWYDPSSGTTPENVGKLLEEYGIPVERGFDRSITDIATALEDGNKVIVGLNANEIWHPQVDEFGNPVELPNEGHSVWVTGMYQDSDGWHVVMNDTGIAEGAAETVALKDFLNAWNDCGNFAVITNIAHSPDLSYLNAVQDLAPTRDDIHNMEILRDNNNSKEVLGENGGNNVVFGSSCSDCSGSCWLTCSGSCYSTNN